MAMTPLQEAVHKHTVNIICAMRGYAPAEVEQWIDENDDDYQEAVASEYADIASILFTLAHDIKANKIE